MSKLTNEQKAQVYNKLMFHYQKLSEQVRLIKAENFELSTENIKKINFLESEMKKIYNETKKLF